MDGYRAYSTSGTIARYWRETATSYGPTSTSHATGMPGTSRKRTRETDAPIDSADAIDVIETGPHRVAVRIARTFLGSRIIQDVRLWSNSARVEFKTTLDWHDRHWLVKARFPLNVRSTMATFETAFGVVERPSHRNTSWDQAKFEVAAHRFADLSEPGYGAALLNDGKYGHHAVGNELGITLLRAPVYPDPLADEGVQSFTYALYPHAGSWLDGGVLMEAEDLNRPLLATAVEGATAMVWQPVRVDGTTVALGAFKAMEDDLQGLILRLYEPQGARGPLRLSLPEAGQPPRRPTYSRTN